MGSTGGGQAARAVRPSGVAPAGDDEDAVPASGFCYRARVTTSPTPDGLLGRPLPDLTLPDVHGADYRLRQFVPNRPLVLFFYVLNGTPG